LENENLEDSHCFGLRKKTICVLNKPESKAKLLQELVGIFLNSSPRFTLNFTRKDL
jgi:hypothetical protein